MGERELRPTGVRDSRPRALGGIGVGFRPQLASALLARPGAVDFVEVVAEACRDGRARREAMAIAEVWPVVPHGVKLSLGSAEPFDMERARDLGRLARDLRAPLVSEHVSFVRGGGREIGHLTELPMTRESVRVVARNVDRLRRVLPDVPLLLENVARAFLWGDHEHEMDEGDFHAEVVRATGCEMLLDAGNLYANAVNAGRDPQELLGRFPLEHVAMIHVAGGVVEDGFYFDTHAHPVPPPVFALVARALAFRPSAAILLERDAAFEDPGAILGELDALRALPREARALPVTARAPAPVEPEGEGTRALAEAQAALAARLTGEDETGADLAVRRARSVLVRKRADDALPLLPALAPRLATCRALELGRIRDVPRLPTMTAVADAMRIAEAARDVPELSVAAARDWLALQARFAGGPSGPRPRAMPWIGSQRLPGGGVAWAFKGFGRQAAVRVYERDEGARP